MDWGYLEMCWRDPKQKQEAEGRLAMEIGGAANPFSKAASLLRECLKHTKGKPSKTPMILLEVLERGSSGKAHSCITRDLQHLALNVALQNRNPNVLNRVCHLYRLSHNSTEFLPEIRSLLQNKKYNEACLIATALNLQEHFTINEIVVPLFYQDKMQSVETYLKGEKEMQLEFLLLLDGLLLDPRRPHSLASSLAVPEVKAAKLHPKTIGKLIARLLKLFDIPPDACPNLCQVRGMGALKYLVNRRFIEGTVDNENWSDLVLGAVGSNRELQRELLVMLVSYNEPQEALRWAMHFQVDRQLWPPVLEDILIQSLDRKTESGVDGVMRSSESQERVVASTEEEEEEEVWELEDTAYLPFRLSRSDIFIVETKEQFTKCLDEVQNYDIVALDGEWRPSFGMQQEKLSLLQVAVWDFVFLLDVQALVGSLSQADWLQLVDRLICNPHIKKFSYGFTSDIRQLARIVPSAQAKLKQLQNMYDFAVLCPKFQLHCPDLLVACSSGQRRVGPSPQDSRGLSSLTLTTLGLPLDKSMQFSDWDKRPLREPQVLYAALDAYCLLQIYEVWHQRASDLGLDFFALAQKAKSSSAPASSTSPQKGKQKGESPLSKQLTMEVGSIDPSRPVVSICDLRVVVDTMLQGLGKHLRICGVDTHILDTEDHHDEAAKVAQREGRVILTSGAPYQQLKQHVPPGSCLNIANGLTAQEQAQIVFRHFNVHLQKDNIFSRCSVCNGNRYVHIPFETLYQMWQRHNKLDWTKECSTRQSRVTYEGGTVDLVKAMIDGKVSIQLHQLKPEVFQRVKVFDVCATCGKVFWEGSHHSRTIKKMEPLLAPQETKTECPAVVVEQESAKSSQVEAVEPPRPTTSSQKSKPIPDKQVKGGSLPPPPGYYSDEDQEDDYQDYDKGYM